MIKTKNGLTKIEGTPAELIADVTAIVYTFVKDEDLCAGKTVEERGEWFKKHIVELAVSSDERQKSVHEAAEMIAKVLNKKTADILSGILDALKDDDDDEDDDE